MPRKPGDKALYRPTGPEHLAAAVLVTALEDGLGLTLTPCGYGRFNNKHVGWRNRRDAQEFLSDDGVWQWLTEFIEPACLEKVRGVFNDRNINSQIR